MNVKRKIKMSYVFFYRFLVLYIYFRVSFYYRKGFFFNRNKCGYVDTCKSNLNNI